MSAAQLVSRLALEGIDQTLLNDVAHALFTAEIERKALADRRQHERIRKAKSRDSTGRNVKSRESRGPPKEKLKPPSSEADASAAVAAADPIKQLFDVGVAVLTGCGVVESRARSLIGKWKKAKGDAVVLQGLLDCRAKSVSEPVEWLEARFKCTKWVSPKGYEYRGTDEQVMREAEKRNDMDTYWRVKRALKEAA